MPSRVVTVAAGTATLEVDVPVESLEPYLHQAAVRLATTHKFEGFRPGKAPYDMVVQRLGLSTVYEEAAEQVVRKTFADAIREHELATIGPPEISVTKLAPGNPLTYTAKVALMPEVKSAQYEKFNARRQLTEVTDADVDDMLTELRTMRASEAAVDRPAALGDRLDITFQLYLDSVPVDGGKGEHFPARLGDKQLIPGFEEHLLGMRTGEEKTFNLTYPQDSPNKQLAGKPVECRVTVHGVREVNLPELDDAFASSLGAFPTVAELRKKVRENIAAERQATSDNAFELAIIDELIAAAKLDPIPEILQHAETNRILHELQHDVEGRGLKWPDYLQHLKKDEAALRNDLSKEADRRIASAILFRHIAEVENIDVKDGELDSAIEERVASASARGVLPEQLRSDDYRDAVRGELRNRKVIDLLKSHALQT